MFGASETIEQRSRECGFKTKGELPGNPDFPLRFMQVNIEYIPIYPALNGLVFLFTSGKYLIPSSHGMNRAVGTLAPDFS
jgi:hypothetical protein